MSDSGSGYSSGQLETADPVEHGVLLGVLALDAVLVEPAAAGSTSVDGPPVADLHGAPHLLRDPLVVGDDQDGHAQPLVHVAQRVEDQLRLASSSSPVGSSAKSTSGALARATAMATRCC